MNIGTKIRDARLAKNMTQEELAKRIGVSKNAISNYENGVSAPKVELLCSIMTVLGIDANYIYGVSGNSSSLLLTLHERDVVVAYRSHPEAQPYVDRILGVSEESTVTDKKA